jgi:Fe2+ transport system protein FeoA
MGSMKETKTTCALCGHQYLPESHQECISCPVQPDCNIICCPSCGFSDVDPSRSKAVNWISSNFFKRSSDSEIRSEFDEESLTSVADLSPGMEAVIVSLENVQEGRREQLMAFGLAPGRCVQVVQHNPATILKIDHTELAIEDAVAKRILVDKPHRFSGKVPGRRLRRRHRLRQRLKFLKRRRNRGKGSG